MTVVHFETKSGSGNVTQAHRGGMATTLQQIGEEYAQRVRSAIVRDFASGYVAVTAATLRASRTVRELKLELVR
jgi:hypothetical protein